MSVSSPRAYTAYAREPAAAVSALGSALDSRRLRARVAVRLGLQVGRRQLPHHRVAPVVQALQAPLLAPGERVRSKNREAHRVVEVAHHSPRQLIRIDLPPAHRLGGRGAREAARVGAGVGDLEIVVVAFLADAEDFLDLRFGLQHEVLRTTDPDDEDAALPAPD